MHPLHHRALRGKLSLGLVHLWLDPAGIEACQHLADVHPVSLLHVDSRNPFVAVEGEVHLAQIDIAVKRELSRSDTAGSVPPEANGTCNSQGGGDDQETSHGVDLWRLE